MRFLVVSTLALLALAVPAYADDAPNYTAEDVIFVQADLPDGWEVIDAEEELPAGLPTEEALMACGGDEVDEFELIAEYRLLQNASGAKAVVAIVDVDTEGGPGPYRAGLKQHASASGWTLTDLASPLRVLVVAGQPADVQTLTAWQVELAAKKLCEMAYYKILQDHSQGRPGRISRERAEEYADAAAKLAPGIKGAVVMRGLLHLYDEKFEEAYATLGKGTRGDGPLAADKPFVVFALTIQGTNMLERKKDELNEPAVDVLERAVALEPVVFEESKRIGQPGIKNLAFRNRYNLACAYARTGMINKSFESLEKAMKLGQLLHGERYIGQFRHMWFWDEDLEPLRKDAARFDTLCKAVAPEKFDWKKEREEAEKQKAERDKREAERKKANEGAAKEKEEGKENPGN